jgi:hypothetical protein
MNQVTSQISNTPVWNSNNNISTMNKVQGMSNHDFVKKEGTFPVLKTTAFPITDEEQVGVGMNSQKQTIKVKLFSICFMDAYKDYSVEELRVIDNKLKKEGKTTTNQFSSGMGVQKNFLVNFYVNFRLDRTNFQSI